VTIFYDKFYKILILRGDCCFVAAYSIWTFLCWCFLCAGGLSNSYSINIFNNFVNFISTKLRLLEDNADALKHLGVRRIYKV